MSQRQSPHPHLHILDPPYRFTPELAIPDSSSFEIDPSLAQDEIDAATAEIINASIRANARAQAEADAAAAAVDSSSIDRPVTAQPRPASNVPAAELDGTEISSSSIDRLPVKGQTLPLSLYPYSRPQRTDETHQHPEDLAFGSKAEFDTWFEGESSWCHYVQRRITNPEKRSEERSRARDKAHAKKLAEMDPEEAALIPPLKKRKRNRTSTVVQKTTYTCHHAGTYTSQHSANLPVEKLRLNTKASVKCGCSSRIVVSEHDTGEVKATYFWKHNGHDPFEENEAETRLPPQVTDWLLSQFRAGREPEDVMKRLQIPDEEKSAYLDQVAADPSAISTDPDMPPPIAFTLRIRYPDVYNRYRRVGPPLKAKRSEQGLQTLTEWVNKDGKVKSGYDTQGEAGKAVKKAKPKPKAAGTGGSTHAAGTNHSLSQATAAAQPSTSAHLVDPELEDHQLFDPDVIDTAFDIERLGEEMANEVGAGTGAGTADPAAAGDVTAPISAPAMDATAFIHPSFPTVSAPAPAVPVVGVGVGAGFGTGLGQGLSGMQQGGVGTTHDSADEEIDEEMTDELSRLAHEITSRWGK